METKVMNTRYRVQVSAVVSAGEPSTEINWPVDTMGEAKAFIEGYKMADTSHLAYSFKVIEIRDVGTVISVHTKDVLNIEVFRDLCSHASEKEAEEHLEYLKREELFDENLDAYDWHFVTVKTEVEVSYD
tara:strand:+ start:101 stop:490 length:390 start_codon:yes stop_codon:yes gene_type:complete